MEQAKLGSALRLRNLGRCLHTSGSMGTGERVLVFLAARVWMQSFDGGRAE